MPPPFIPTYPLTHRHNNGRVKKKKQTLLDCLEFKFAEEICVWQYLSRSKSCETSKIPAESDVLKRGGSQILKTLTRLLMHVAIATVIVPYASKKGSTYMWKGKKKKIWRCGSELVVAWVFFCIYICVCVCVYWRNNQDALIISIPVMRVWIGIFHIYWYGNVYIQCHMLYILLHLRRVVSDNWVADANTFVSFTFLKFFFSLPQRSVIYCTCQHGAIKKPVIIVHPVNHIFFLLLFCQFCLLWIC